MDDINVIISSFKNLTGTYKNVILKTGIDLKNQLNEVNTIYHIKWDFDLNGESVTIPENCMLQFDGGSLSNGTLIGDNTSIDAGLVKIFENNCNVGGTWTNTVVYPQWYGVYPDNESFDLTVVIQKLLNFSKKIHISRGTWYMSECLIAGKSNILIEGENKGYNTLTNIRPFYKNQSYILKLGGRHDFKNPGDNDQSYNDIAVKGFSIDNIGFYIPKEYALTDSNEDIISSAALCLDWAAEGYLNINFMVNQSRALYIANSWEILFDYMKVYGGYIPTDMSAIYFGKAYTSFKASNISAVTFNNLYGEDIAGKFIDCDLNANIVSLIFNTIEYEDGKSGRNNVTTDVQTIINNIRNTKKCYKININGVTSFGVININLNGPRKYINIYDTNLELYVSGLINIVPGGATRIHINELKCIDMPYVCLGNYGTSAGEFLIENLIASLYAPSANKYSRVYIDSRCININTDTFFEDSTHMYNSNNIFINKCDSIINPDYIVEYDKLYIDKDNFNEMCSIIHYNNSVVPVRYKDENNNIIEGLEFRFPFASQLPRKYFIRNSSLLKFVTGVCNKWADKHLTVNYYKNEELVHSDDIKFTHTFDKSIYYYSLYTGDYDYFVLLRENVFILISLESGDFENKKYIDGYGSGRIVLKKNKSLSSLLNQNNTIYVVKYDFDLNGETITFPKNSTLLFEGGHIYNGLFTGGPLLNDEYNIRDFIAPNSYDITQGLELLFSARGSESATKEIEGRRFRKTATIYIPSGMWTCGAVTFPAGVIGIRITGDKTYLPPSSTWTGTIISPRDNDQTYIWRIGDTTKQQTYNVCVENITFADHRSNGDQLKVVTDDCVNLTDGALYINWCSTSWFKQLLFLYMKGTCIKINNSWELDFDTINIRAVGGNSPKILFAPVVDGVSGYPNISQWRIGTIYYEAIEGSLICSNVNSILDNGVIDKIIGEWYPPVRMTVLTDEEYNTGISVPLIDIREGYRLNIGTINNTHPTNIESYKIGNDLYNLNIILKVSNHKSNVQVDNINTGCSSSNNNRKLDIINATDCYLQLGKIMISNGFVLAPHDRIRFYCNAVRALHIDSIVSRSYDGVVNYDAYINDYNAYKYNCNHIYEPGLITYDEVIPGYLHIGVKSGGNSYYSNLIYPFNNDGSCVIKTLVSFPANTTIEQNFTQMSMFYTIKNDSTVYNKMVNANNLQLINSNFNGRDYYIVTMNVSINDLVGIVTILASQPEGMQIHYILLISNPVLYSRTDSITDAISRASSVTDGHVLGFCVPGFPSGLKTPYLLSATHGDSVTRDRVSLFQLIPSGSSSYNGAQFFDTSLGKAVYWNGVKWIEYDGAIAGVKRKGTTSERPNGEDIYEGFQYFDTELNKIIYVKNIDNEVMWIDANGNPVETVYAINESLDDYLLKTDANDTYLSKVSADNKYLTKTDAASTYLTKIDAANTYLTEHQDISGKVDKVTNAVAGHLAVFTADGNLTDIEFNN